MIARKPAPKARHSTLALCLLALSSALVGMFTTWAIAPITTHVTAAPTTLDSATLVLPTPTLINQPILASACKLTNTQPTYAILRTAPADQYALLGLIPPRGMIDAIGMTSSGWYAVNYGERLAWISSAAVTGDAATEAEYQRLPTLRNPIIPNAPRDAYMHVINVDRDGDARYVNAISTPDGDTRDLLMVVVINLFSEPPNNYRERVISLNCIGEGSDYVRWGVSTRPTLRCGDMITLPFLINNHRQTFAVTFTPNAPQSYVEYELSVLQAVG